MIAVIIAPFYIAANILIMIQCLNWLKSSIGIFRMKSVQIIFIICFALMMTASLLELIIPAATPRRILKYLGTLWLGIFLYLVLYFVLGKLVDAVLGWTRLATKESIRNGLVFRITGFVVLACTAVTCVAGMVHAQVIKVKNYEISTEKSGGNLKELNICLLADLHLGYNAGTGLMKQMVEKVNAQHPDIILCAGDIFDNSYEALDDPEKLESVLSGLESTYGTYCVMGNHDIEETILGGFTFSSSKPKVTDERYVSFVKASNMTLLSDESVLIDDSFYLVGRRDYECPGNESNSRKTEAELLSGLDTSKLLICLDHEPRNLEAVSAAGFDLDLNGHTHAGQIWPGTEVIKYFWENPQGYKKIGNMQNIVTAGVGSFGPYMRTGCDSEISCIHLEFS